MRRPFASSPSERHRARLLTLAEVLEIHADQLRLFGGSEGIRDQGALESAVATPEATFAGAFLHETLWEMAAAYAFHIAQNQPFLDGNKRVGLNACLLFLTLNGWQVNDPHWRALRCHDRFRRGHAGEDRTGGHPSLPGNPARLS